MGNSRHRELRPSGRRKNLTVVRVQSTQQSARVRDNVTPPASPYPAATPSLATAVKNSGPKVTGGNQQANNYVRDSYPLTPSGQARSGHATAALDRASTTCPPLDCQAVSYTHL